MEMFIIGSGCALGYLLNRNGKQNRSATEPIVVSANRRPNGPLIYDSHRVEEVDDYVRNLAARKHSDRVRQMYPYDYDRPTSIYPMDPFKESGTPANLTDVGGGLLPSARQNYVDSVAQALKSNVNVAAYNPQTGRPLGIGAANVQDSAMFRPAAFAPAASTLMSEFQGPVSLLSGRPLDMTHANMQPMFGRNVKQPAVTNENSQVLLEMYTGTSSSDDQGTYRQKREVLNPLPNNPENLQRANIQQVSDLYQRAQLFVKPSHEYQTPVKSFRDLPMNNDVRVMPASIDQIRGINHKQVTYQGVMIPGQKGSTRAMLQNLRANPWDLSSITNPQDMTPNRSTFVGNTQHVLPNVRNVLATQETQANYMAPPNNWRKVKDFAFMAETYKNQMDDTVTKRMEPFAPGFGIARGSTGKSTNTGVFMVRDPEKGFATERQGQPHQNIGSRIRNVSAPDATFKETFTDVDTGPMNASGLKSNTAYKNQNVDLVMTNKSMDSENTYTGLPGKNLGMGNRKVKIQEWVTNKEMNQFSKQGNPKGLIPAHMSYDSVFEVSTNKEVDGERFGTAKGAYSKPIQEGAVEADAEKLLVEDYFTNPTGPSKGVDREQFYEGLEMDYDRVDFGGYLHGGKYGNGEDAKRSGAVTLKEALVVEGRMNVPLKRDNPNDNLEMEANLRPEQETVPRKVINRTQPKAVTHLAERGTLLTRTKNTEVLNPRMDPGTKVRLTSDPYPWIKDRGDDLAN